MTFTPTETTLKNGKKISIRPAVTSDAPALIRIIQTYIKDSDHLLLTTDEFQPTIAQEEEWIASFGRSSNSLLLVAEHKGELIGNIDLNGSPRRRLAHTAMVGMGMLLEWRNTGLGTALLTAAIEWAIAHPVLERLWLQLYHNNEAGLALYRKCGFTEEGRQRAFIKVAENLYADNVLMARPVISTLVQ
jgi:RimJ/RimL family protein N-acetyltransferase